MLVTDLMAAGEAGEDQMEAAEKAKPESSNEEEDSEEQEKVIPLPKKRGRRRQADGQSPGRGKKQASSKKMSSPVYSQSADAVPTGTSEGQAEAAAADRGSLAYMDSSSFEGEQVEQIVSIPSPAKLPAAASSDVATTKSLDLHAHGEAKPEEQAAGQEEFAAAKVHALMPVPQKIKKRRGRPKKIKVPLQEEAIDVSSEAAATSVDAREKADAISVDVREDPSVLGTRDEAMDAENKEVAGEADTSLDQTGRQKSMEVADKPESDFTLGKALESPLPAVPTPGRRKRGRPPKKARDSVSKVTMTSPSSSAELEEVGSDIDARAQADEVPMEQVVSESTSSLHEPSMLDTTARIPVDQVENTSESMSAFAEPSTSAVSEDVQSPEATTPAGVGKKKGRRGRPPKKREQQTVDEGSALSVENTAQPAEPQLSSQPELRNQVLEEKTEEIEEGGAVIEQDKLEMASAMDTEPLTTAAAPEDLLSPEPTHLAAVRKKKGRRGQWRKKRGEGKAAIDEGLAAPLQPVEATLDSEMEADNVELTSTVDVEPSTPAASDHPLSPARALPAAATKWKKGKRGRPPKKMASALPAADKSSSLLEDSVELKLDSEVMVDKSGLISAIVPMEEKGMGEAMDMDKSEVMDASRSGAEGGDELVRDGEEGVPRDVLSLPKRETEVAVKPTPADTPIPRRKRGRPPKSAKKMVHTPKTLAETKQAEALEETKQEVLEEMPVEKTKLDQTLEEVKEEEMSLVVSGDKALLIADVELEKREEEQPILDKGFGETKGTVAKSLKDGSVSPHRKQRGRKRQRSSFGADTDIPKAGTDVPGLFVECEPTQETVPDHPKLTGSLSIHSPREESRSSGDNIFDIMSSVSPSKSETPDHESLKPRSKKGKSPKHFAVSKSPKSGGRKAKVALPDRDQAVVKRGHLLARQRPTPNFTDFTLPSSSRSRSADKQLAVRAGVSSEEAVVIRRRPRPLASPDTAAPPLPSHISPVRPIGHTDYSEGYSSVLIKRRRTADWSASPDQVERESSRFARFSNIQQASTSKSSTELSGHFSEVSASLGVKLTEPSASGKTLKPSVVSRKTDSSAFKRSLLASEKKSVKKVTKVSQSGKKSRTKVRAGEAFDLMEVTGAENHRDGSTGQKTQVKEQSSHTPTNLGTVSDGKDVDDTVASPTSPSQASPVQSSTATSDVKSESSSVIRRSSRPVVPSQRMRESDILKRRLSGGDSGEPLNKTSRTLQ